MFLLFHTQTKQWMLRTDLQFRTGANLTRNKTTRNATFRKQAISVSLITLFRHSRIAEPIARGSQHNEAA